MPKPIYYLELKMGDEFEQADKETVLQPLFKTTYQQTPHLLKLAPINQTIRVQNIRLLNEAIYGKAAEIFAQKMREKFIPKITAKLKRANSNITKEDLNNTIESSLKSLVVQTPAHHLVLNNDNEIKGVLTQVIPYYSIRDYGQSFDDFVRVFTRPSMAMISALRFVFDDLDAYNNIGYDKKEYKKFEALSSIDYGLAGFNQLFILGALSADEQDKLPTENPTAFEINEASVLSGLFHRMNEVETLAHHAFGISGDEYISKISKTEPALIKAYSIRLKNMYNDLVLIMLNEDFEKEMKEALNYSVLSLGNQAFFDIILKSLIGKIHLLDQSCVNLLYSPPAQIKQFAEINEIDAGTTKTILSSSYAYTAAQINERLQQRVVEEQDKRVGGQISPAHGGNSYSGILQPTARKLSLWSNSSSSRSSSSNTPTHATPLSSNSSSSTPVITSPLLSFRLTGETIEEERDEEKRASSTAAMR